MSRSLLPSFLDIILIKLFKKKIFWIFLGSEIRTLYGFLSEFGTIDSENWTREFKNENLNSKLYFLRIVEKYADKIYSIPDQSSLAIRPYYLVFLPFINDHIPENTFQRKIPVILHAPTSKLKGTKFFEEALQKIKSENIAFIYRRVENVSNEQLIKEILDSDIILDECIAQGPGLFGLESLSAGKVVLCRATPLKQYPIIDVKPETVYDQLKEIIQNHDLRVYLAKKSRLSVQVNNNPSKIIENILTSQNEILIKPKFYLENLINKIKNSNKLSKRTLQINKEIYRKYSKSS
jgi:hypothetical protein